MQISLGPLNQLQRKLIHFRFARHAPLLDAKYGTAIPCAQPGGRLRAFLPGILDAIERAGPGDFYVLFPNEVQRDLARVRPATVFPKVNSLPHAERQPAAADGNTEVHARERGTHVGGHVVLAFAGVRE